MSLPETFTGELLEVLGLNVFDGSRQILRQINFTLSSGSLLAVIGPLGSGKTSLLRSLNRLNEVDGELRMEGEVLLSGKNIYDRSVDVRSLRKTVGMVFSAPTLFPGMSLFENVAVGPRIWKHRSGAEVRESVEKALRQVALWDDVKDRLDDDPGDLGAGDAQKVCVARALVLRPKILLMDEPTSTLNLQEVSQFEQMLQKLRETTTVLFTTSHRKQAARVSDKTAFLLDGELIEIGRTSEMFMNPKDMRTEDYLTGRFG